MPVLPRPQPWAQRVSPQTYQRSREQVRRENEALLNELRQDEARAVEAEQRRRFAGRKARTLKAAATIEAMLDGKRPYRLKEAVWYVEWAHTATLDSNWFYGRIAALGTAAAMPVKGRPAPDKLYGALASLYRDSIRWADKARPGAPLHYDFDNPGGDKDPRRLFVSKLLQTHSGQCHSLPLLYKILADEAGLDAWLALSPAHSFIRHKGPDGEWKNLELTNGGQYMDDDTYLQSGYLALAAVAAGAYMDTLGETETLCQCLGDLAGDWIAAADPFDDEAVAIMLTGLMQRRCPRLYAGYMLAANVHTMRMLRRGDQLGRPPLAEALKDGEFAAIYRVVQGYYGKLDGMGYEPFPEDEYQKWVVRLQ